MGGCGSDDIGIGLQRHFRLLAERSSEAEQCQSRTRTQASRVIDPSTMVHRNLLTEPVPV